MCFESYISHTCREFHAAPALRLAFALPARGLFRLLVRHSYFLLIVLGASPGPAVASGTKLESLAITTPQGVAFVPQKVIDPFIKRELLTRLDAVGGTINAQLYRRVVLHPTWNWLSCALVHSEPLVWPKGQGISAVLKDSTVVPAGDILASGPEKPLIPIALGQQAVLIQPSRVWRYRDATVVFIGFPSEVQLGTGKRSWSASDIARITIGPTAPGPEGPSERR